MRPGTGCLSDEKRLSGFGYFPGFDTARANLHSLSPARWSLHANGLQIRIKTPRRSIVCVGNVIPKLRTFAADFATFSHDFL
jgi:hypothetical protein